MNGGDCVVKHGSSERSRPLQVVVGEVGLHERCDGDQELAADR